MTVNVYYLKEAGQKNYGSRFESHQVTHRLQMDQCAGSIGLTSTAAVLDRFADGIGEDGWRFKVGSPLQWDPDGGTSFSNYTRATEYGAWIVRNVSVDPNPNKAGSFIVTIQETNMGRRTYVTLDGGNTEFQGDYDFAMNFTATSKQQQAWRSDPKLAADESGKAIYSVDGTDFRLGFCKDPWKYCNRTDDDIEGTDISILNAQPIKITTAQTQMTVEYVIREPIQLFDGSLVTPYVNTAGNDPRLFTPTLEAQIGDRNFDGLGSFDRGSLLLTGVSVQPLHFEFKRVQLTLVYDEWYHASQRPYMTNQGAVVGELQCDGEDADVIDLTPLGVGWLQPYLTGFSWGQTPDTYFNDGFTDRLITALYGDPSSFAASPAGACDGT